MEIELNWKNFPKYTIFCGANIEIWKPPRIAEIEKTKI